MGPLNAVPKSEGSVKCKFGTDGSKLEFIHKMHNKQRMKLGYITVFLTPNERVEVFEVII